MLPTVVDQKKRNKRDRLLGSALDLFLEKGPGATSIDDIVQRAGVAKGTFYLYFKDRNDILEDLVVRESAQTVGESFARARQEHPESPDEEILLAIRELLDQLRESPGLLALIHRNLSWSVVSRRLATSDAAGQECHRLARGRSDAEFGKLAFVILELVFSVAYSSIVMGEPAGIDEMEDYLLGSVRKLLK